MLNIFNEKLNNYIEKKDYKSRYFNQKGINRHYPPANIEWFNSIFAYNKNTTKTLPRADKTLLKFIKSYFNLYNSKLEKKVKARPLRLRFRRLSVNRILVSRAELKHTSDKVNITIYIYNRHLKYFNNKLNKLPSLNLYKKRRHKKKKLKKIVKKGLKIISNVLKQKKILFKTLNKSKSKNKQRSTMLRNTVFNNYEKKYLKNFILKYLRREIIYFYIKQIIFINKSKFKYNYLLPLTNLIERYYKKKIEFNLVNLKYFYLNSYIFTDTIVKKIRRNKKRNPLYILKKSLMFKRPTFNKQEAFEEMYSKKRIIQNFKVQHVLSNFISSIKKSKIISYDDNLDLILKKNFKVIVEPWKVVIAKFFNSSSNSNLRSKNKKKFKQNVDQVADTVLDSIKYKFVKGIRIEAAGRLTKRYTAAKSIFKKVYKGNLQNMDSSFKGLSTVILRGHCKSNLQYTNLSSWRRIGSFGIKGWVSSSN